MKMNNANAIAFFILGTVTQTLPLMGATGLGAQESKTLWLHFMGFITAVIGASYLLRSAAILVSAALSRLALRRAEAREQYAQGAHAHRSMSLGARIG